MVKLKNIQMYKSSEIDPKVVEQMKKCSFEISEVLMNISNNTDPNVFLGSLTFILATFIKELVSDDLKDQHTASIAYTRGLISNLARLNGKEPEEWMMIDL